MKSARFLKMVETIQGIGFLYHLSEPFYGANHVFVTPDYYLHRCDKYGQALDLTPWLAPEAEAIPEIFQNFGYGMAS